MDRWRPYLVLAVLALMFLGVGAHLILRPSGDHQQAASEAPDAAATARDAGVGDGAVDAAPPDIEEIEEDVASERGDAGLAADAAGDPEPRAPSRLMDRPLRVVAQGWEVLTPGLMANGGLAPGEGESRFSARRLDVTLAVRTELTEITRALARGGLHPEGADVAVIALPELVRLQEELAPLRPEALMVAGWSRGRHELRAARGDVLFDTTPVGDVIVAARRGEPEHLLALWALELAGVRPSRVRVVAPDAEEAPEALLWAVGRDLISEPPSPAPRDVVLSTGQAGRLIPYVMIAPRRMLVEHRRALVLLGLTWLDAAGEVSSDVPGAARWVSTLEGAPEALEMMRLLSRIAPSDVAENAELSGMSGRGALTLDDLTAETGRLWREAEVIPDHVTPRLPISEEASAVLLRAGLSEGTPAADERRGSRSGLPFAVEPVGDEIRPVLLVRSSALSGAGDGGVRQLGRIAAIFHPSPMRVVGVLEAQRLEPLVQAAWERFDLPEERLLGTIAGPVAGVEVVGER